MDRDSTLNAALLAATLLTLQVGFGATALWPATVEVLFPVLFLWPVLAAARVGLTASGGWTASVAASLLMGLGGIGLISLLIATDPTCTANWPKGCMGLVFARGLIVEAYLPVVFACLALGGLMRVVRVRLGHLRR